ncbi:MAG: twin-arginine translocase subunit TatC, partial [Armatimonadetes bacterium CG_4_9_14_3_um_filter_58_7]
PDPVNMTLLAAPILGLYLLSVVVVKAVERKRPTTFQ